MLRLNFSPEISFVEHEEHAVFNDFIRDTEFYAHESYILITSLYKKEAIYK